MEIQFWHDRWENKEIGFHLSKANPLLVENLAALDLANHSRIFVPLCGKTRDIAWLLSQGHNIIGAELSLLAIEDLFSELGVTPTKVQTPTHTHFSAPNIDIFVGDIFTLTPDDIGKIDMIYDRAALVALPDAMRSQYTKHLTALTKSAPQLLICFEYDQTALNGPPFSIQKSEIHRQYKNAYTIKHLTSVKMEELLKGTCEATETVWNLY
ncbi:MAG: thiopurine S-methyltransferase [Robiginitomaculum sp.]|nr:MAG: thiopurine S-methyltransferase [Robiginitomaculum sp.]